MVRRALKWIFDEILEPLIILSLSFLYVTVAVVWIALRGPEVEVSDAHDRT